MRKVHSEYFFCAYIPFGIKEKPSGNHEKNRNTPYNGGMHSPVHIFYH